VNELKEQHLQRPPALPVAGSRFSRYLGSFRSAAILFVGLIGIVLIAFSGHTIYRNRVARRWPVTEGRIVSSRTFLKDASGGKPGNAKVARAQVRFAYQVNGRQYESSNVSYHRGIGGSDIQQDYDPSYAVRYPEGTAVKVAYDPAEPQACVIEASPDPYFAFSIGLVSIVTFFAYQIWLRGTGA
jgi:hypothetical protein